MGSLGILYKHTLMECEKMSGEEFKAIMEDAAVAE